MMKLYHGTNIDFSEIDFSKCKPNKDFGQGFYLTDIKKQALEMAVRRCNFEQSGAPIVQEYEFDETVLHDGSLKIKIFDGVCPEWAEFILKTGHQEKKSHTAMMLWLDPLLTMVWFTNSTSTNNISLQ